MTQTPPARRQGIGALRAVPSARPRNDLSTELDHIFRIELRDRLGAMRAVVDDLGRGVDQRQRQRHVDSLIGHAHSLKGAAQIVGLPRLAAVAGALEERLDAAPHDETAARRAIHALAQFAEQYGLEGVDRDTTSVSTPAPRQRDSAPGLRGVPGRLRILHVEDGRVNRALVRAIFHRTSEPRVRDCDLLIAESLAAARAILRSQQPVDLVLLDLRLPDGDGLDLAREIANAPGRRVPVVVLSASVPPAARLAALDAAGDQFISKPVDPAQLVATIVALTRLRSRPAT